MPFHRQAPVRLASIILGYMLFCWAMRIIFITLVTYFFIKNHSSLNDMGDIVRANQVLTCGVAAFAYVLFLQSLYPLTATRWSHVLPSTEFREQFPKGAIHGIMVSAALLAGTAFGGHMSYLGFYIKFDEVILSLLSVVFFSGSIFMLAIVEEYLIRKCFEPYIEARAGRLAAVAAGIVLYVAIKYAQFEVGWIEALNLALLSLCLSYLCRTTGSFLASAGFATGLFVLAHALFGLPLFGQDVAGIFLMRAPSDGGIGSLLSGGAQGPEGGLVLTILLAAFWLNRRVRSKN